MNSKIIEKSGTTDKKKALNILFALYVSAEVLFGHTIISQTCLVAFVGFVLLSCTYNKIPKIFVVPYSFLILWSYYAIYTKSTIDRTSALALTKTMVINLVFLTAFAIYFKTINNIDEILNVFKTSALVLCIPILVLGLASALSGHRLENTGINSNFLGSFMATALIILIYQVTQKKGGRVWNIVQFVAIAGVILLSGSRISLILIAICMCIFVSLRNPKRALLNIFIIVSVLIIVLIAIMKIPTLYQLVGHRLETLFLYIQGEETNDASINARARYIERGWELFLERPQVGYGADTFRGVFGQYAHCNFIELLFSFGAMGILYYVPFLYCIFKLIKYRKQIYKGNKDLLLLCAGLIIAIVICDYARVTYYERIALLPINIVILAVNAFDPKKEEFK